MGGTGWMEQAACAGVGVELFFPESGRRAKKDYEYAASVCAVCPVTQQCLEFALRTETVFHTRHGMWGGTIPQQRQAIQGQRDRRKATSGQRNR